MRTLAYAIAFASSAAPNTRARETARPRNLLEAGGPGVGILELRDEQGPVHLADPFVERDPFEGRVRVYGTSADHYLEYANEDDFLFGGTPVRVKVQFTHPCGAAFRPDEMPWDLTPLKRPGGRDEIFLAGVMSPPPGATHASWPLHNSGRRTYVFTRETDRPHRLVRSAEPLFSDTAKHDWIGHNYGRDFLRDADGKALKNPDGTLMMVYERVTRRFDDGRLVTEIASRPLDPSTLRTGPEKILLTIDDHKPYPAAKRTNRHLTIEGPRLARMRSAGRELYVMGFSSGDFPTDRYGVNFAYSASPEGPYTPVLTPDGHDLRDFACELRAKYGLSWGPARPQLYRSRDGRQWLVFHALKKADHPGVDFSKWPADLGGFRRGIFIVPFHFHIKGDGTPEFHLAEYMTGHEPLKPGPISRAGPAGLPRR